MRRVLFYITIYMAIVLLTACSKPDKKEKKTQIEKAFLEAATTEVSTMLLLIRNGQMAYKIENDTYMECLPSPPDGGNDSKPDKWVDAGGFEEINFEPVGRVYYQYAVNISVDGQSFTATATGDVDENGVKVRHTITSSSPAPKRSPANEY